jgi:hypothetical protein
LRYRRVVDGKTRARQRYSGLAIGFAPDEKENLPPDVALAYASVFKAPPKPTFDQRWTAWGAAYGGSNSTNGDEMCHCVLLPHGASKRGGAGNIGFAGVTGSISGRAWGTGMSASDCRDQCEIRV